MFTSRLLAGKLLEQASFGIVPMESASYPRRHRVDNGAEDAPETARGFSDHDCRGLLPQFLALEVSLKGVQEEAVVWYREPVYELTEAKYFRDYHIPVEYLLDQKLR